MYPIQTRARAPSVRAPAVHPLGPQLLSGCYTEAARADDTSFRLHGLRDALAVDGRPNLDALNAIIAEIRMIGARLRYLADQSQVHMWNSNIIDYLNVILPCLQKTLCDIDEFYNDKSKSKDDRWRNMYYVMSNELPGTTLVARFILYNQYLSLLQFLLNRSPFFDYNAMASLRLRIFQLREARQISPPRITSTELVRQESVMDFWGQETRPHWAEAIFSQPLPSRRVFKTKYKSVVCGTLFELGRLPPFQPTIRTLATRSFSNDRVSVIILLDPIAQAPYFLVRTIKKRSPWVSLRGVHELCINRAKDSRLDLTRWSNSERRAKPWAELSFSTWEDMVLFYCTFVCLKARSLLRINVKSSEFVLEREKLLFQAKIVDDRFYHCLNVYEDQVTKGVRLHACVWDGKLQHCPVWTAFIPVDISESWVLRKSRHCVWLRDIQIYTFCDEYRDHHQRKNKLGAFQIRFLQTNGARKFRGLFRPDPEPTVISVEVSSSDEDEGEDDDAAAGPSGG
ncbi:Uu.00g012490.m01.CDS01 [Anthostomella pinea]|uniref:Uu.00g012490.m01.CDS01 n=1 Tax=Anthostomella pinea TaxID=933095 RepID=A0AAI8YQ84_9PEZI|nr:Uu.00g012490.m01.CDS01 [Anthostomella pinea]